MRIAVVGSARAGTDPRTVRLVTSLGAAGHDVAFLSSGSVDGRIENAAKWTITVDTRRPRRKGKMSGALRRMNPRWVRSRNADTFITSALSDLRPDLVYANTRELATLADRFGFVVATDTGLQFVAETNDLGSLAPAHPELAGFVANDEAWVNRSFTAPAPGRHTGKHLILCYHPTATTPARYLQAALERAGVRVEHRYPDIDLSMVPRDVDGVLFVESPYPALEVTGATDVPVLFWVHHGEHHLYPNLRLAERYAADGILLAHSLHLGHRFAVPVFPFPFGVPTEMLGFPDEALSERALEVSMVASGFDDDGARYATRRDLAAQLTSRFGSERVLFTGGLSPEEMFSVYARSKIVIDEGGSLHRPVTMRVFEATGSGAALATDSAPGIEMLFEPGTEFIPLDPNRGVGDLPTEDQLARIAQAGTRRALGVHTYDHRVDELMSVFSSVLKNRPTEVHPSTTMRTMVATHAEIDSLACQDPAAGDFAESSYVVWSHREATDRGISVDAVVLGPGESPSEALLALAHRYVFCSISCASTVRSMLSAANRVPVESTRGNVVVFDFGTSGYVVRDTP